jgi:hypothetical protein
VGHHRVMPLPDSEPTEVCPGCGAVLVRADEPVERPGASGPCARLFEVTLLGLREQAGTDPAAAAAVTSADAAYDAQHPDPVDGVRRGPRVWRTTIADVAADLDVIDLPVLVEAWAAAVAEDCAVTGTTTR